MLADGLLRITLARYAEEKKESTPMQQYFKNMRIELLRQRMAVRKYNDFNLTEADESCHIKGMLKYVDNRLRMIQGDRNLADKARWKRELYAALEVGEMKLVWNAARKVSSSALGPKNTYYRKSRSCTPTVSEWCEFLAGVGADGGCEAEKIALEDVRKVEDTPTVCPSSEDYKTADVWLKKVKKRIMEMPLRKGVPPMTYRVRFSGLR